MILGAEEIDVVNELADLEREGIICGYHTLINWEKTSIEKVSALIEVRVTPQRGQGFDNIAERIYKYPEVDAVYLSVHIITDFHPKFFQTCVRTIKSTSLLQRIDPLVANHMQ